MSTTDAAMTFWTEQEKYHDLVETVERNITIDKPRENYTCDVLPGAGHCSWCASRVTYYNYTGPDVKHI